MRLETLSRIIQQFLLLIVRLFFRNACGTEMLPQTEMLLNLGIYWIVFLHFLCICSNAKWSELNQILKSITFQNGINYLGFCCNLSWWSFSVCNNNVFMQKLPTSAFLSNLDYKEHCRCLQRHLNNTLFDIFANLRMFFWSKWIRWFRSRENDFSYLLCPNMQHITNCHEQVLWDPKCKRLSWVAAETPNMTKTNELHKLEVLH